MAYILVLTFIVGIANAQTNNTSKNATQKSLSKIENDQVSIQKIPTTLNDFKSLQAELGTTPEGCVMLQLVAMEMYRRDRSVGKKCLELNNTDANIGSVTRRLANLYRKDDSYSRPYLVASCFMGAKPSNGYNPEKPYTIKVRKNPTKTDEKSQMLKGTVVHLQVYSDGYDKPWRNVDVVLQKKEPYYRVSNCPAILTQCKKIDFDASENWKELK